MSGIPNKDCPLCGPPVLIHHMNQRTLYYAIGWTIIVAFAVTLFITVGALIGHFRIEPRYLNALFVKLILEVVAAAFFLFYRGPGEELPPYAGDWQGHVHWTDDWARVLMDAEKISTFKPINPRSEGDLYIYRAGSGVYKSFSTWTVKNSDTAIATVAVVGNNFKFDPKGILKSFDVRAHSRKSLLPKGGYGPSPFYTWRFTEATSHRLVGSMTTMSDGREIEVGTVLLERN